LSNDFTDYSLNYESSDVTLMDDNDLERSLREILPSEGHRRKVQNEGAVDTSVRTDAVAAMGELCLLCLLL